MARFPTDMQSRILKSQSERTRYDREWSAAIKMLRGEQWSFWDNGNSRFRTMDRKGGEVRVTVNQMLNIERNIIARLAINTPTPVVLPASDTVDDLTKATGSEMALRYFWLSDKQDRKWQAAIRWMAQTGNVVLHTYFDPGHEVKRASESMPGDGAAEIFDGQKEDKSIGSKKVKGKVTCDVISPFNVFFEPGVTSPGEARWVALRTFVTKPELKDLYPEKQKEIDALSADDGVAMYMYQDYRPSGRVDVYEVYWRDGRHAIIAGDLYLQKEVSEDVRQAFPVRMIRYHVVEGDLWGLGPMVQIADLQQLYNRTRTQIHANVRLMGNPPWLVPRTADVRKGSFMNKPGAVIRYTPGGGAPTPANPQQMPSHVLREPSVLREEMSDVAGAHGITLGRREPGVKSGVHARTLTQQDATQLLSTQQEIVAAVEDVMLTVLMLMKRHYNQTRVMKMLDVAGEPVWKAISGAEIVDDPEIHIDGNTLFKVDAAAREAKVMELVQLGLMGPEEAREAISWRTYNKQVTQKFIQLSHARDVLQATIQGHEFRILPTDDLEAFTQVFTEFTQSPDFYELPVETQGYIETKIREISLYGQPEEVFAEAERLDTVSPRVRAPKKEAPQLQAVAQPAPPQDPLSEVAFPTSGQNLPGMPGTGGV